MSLSDKINTRRLEFMAVFRSAAYLHGMLIPSSNWSPATFLDRQAKKRPNSYAIKYQDEKITWLELQQRVDRSAQGLVKLGVKKADKVVILVDNRPEFLVMLLALSRLQAISVLINTSLVGKALIHCINIGKARICLVGSEHSEKIPPILQQLDLVTEDSVYLIQDSDIDSKQYASLLAASPFHDLAQYVNNSTAPIDKSGFPKTKATVQDICSYIYTSGTTGLPKPAIVRNQRILAGGMLMGRGMANLKPDESIFIASPLFHTAALSGGFGSSLLIGSCLVIRRHFSASAFWDDIRKHQVDVFIYIGELCRYLVNQAPRDNDRDHPLRAMVGVGLRPDVWREFIQRFGVTEICEGYGATEGTSPIYNFAAKVGMIGRKRATHALLRCDLASGELQANAAGFYEQINPGETGLLLNRVSTRTPFDGYVDASASQKKLLHNVFKKGDCYFNTGDLLTLHDDNWLSFADRLGDTFRWKGENVSTNEVAEILNSCPGVLESNVYGVEVPNNEGRAGMASINIAEDFDLTRLTNVISDNLASYQRPYFLRVQKDMEITQTFKHKKVDYQKQGFNPETISDKLYFLQKGQYCPLDKTLFEQINEGVVDLK